MSEKHFNPDWDLLKATQESLREHMKLLSRYKRIINELSLINPYDLDAVITLRDSADEILNK